MKTLVTGANGFLGKYLLIALTGRFPKQDIVALGTKPQGPQSPQGIPYVSCDLLDEEKTIRVIKEIAPKRVFHLAGESRVADELGMPEYFSRNYLCTVSLLRALSEIRPSVELFFTSSVHVYGSQTEEVNENSLAHPESLYAFTKYLAEEAIRHHAQSNPALRVVIGRLYTCFGPGQPEGFVASDFCKKILALPKEGTPVLEVGPLDAYRRFLDVRDVTSLILELMDIPSNQRLEIYNIASPFEHRISEILNLLLTLTGRKADVRSRTTLTNRFRGLRLNLDKLKRTMPEYTFRPVEQTLQDMLATYPGA